jgi:hypothetical protein
MGWYFGWYSRKELIEHLTKTTDEPNFKFETLAKCFVGNNMWTVMQRTNKRANCPEAERVIRFIVLYYIRRGGREDWGYKDVSEDMGPSDVNCPLKYLDMSPDGAKNSESATEWRKNVREYWKDIEDGRKVASELKYGDLFKGKREGSELRVYLGPYLRRDGKPTGQIIYRAHPDGRRYRMKPAGIVKAEAPAAV